MVVQAEDTQKYVDALTKENCIADMDLIYWLVLSTSMRGWEGEKGVDGG